MSALCRFHLPVKLLGAATILVVTLLQCVSAASRTELVTVVSTNVCADQLILALAEPEQIASLSFLSHDESASHFHELATQFPTNRAHAEEILPLQPTVVIAGEYANHYTLQTLRRIDLDVKILPIANSIDDMLENILKVSGWIGQESKGINLVASLRQRLSNLPGVTDARPSMAIYDPNGYTVGVNSLRGDLLERAGWHNVATDVGIEQFGSLSLETMVRLKPTAIMESPYSEGTWSHAQALNRHPALTQRGIDAEIIRFNSRDTICAGPWSITLIEQLAHHRKTLPQGSDHSNSLFR